MIEPISRGVLDTRMRGYDELVWGAVPTCCSLSPTRYSPLPYLTPSTTAIARCIASAFAAALSGTDCRFSPGSSKSWVAP